VIDCLVIFFRAARPDKKMGSGSSPRSLSPIHWHLAPSFTRRVTLAVSFPTLRWSAWTIANHSGPAAEPASGVTTAGFLDETSQPVLHTLASVLGPDPVRMLLRSSASSPLPQGRHRDPVVPDTEKLGCDRLPCATGLVSYSSSCVFLLS
jgi:hypothetical protein